MKNQSTTLPPTPEERIAARNRLVFAKIAESPEYAKLAGLRDALALIERSIKTGEPHTVRSLGAAWPPAENGFIQVKRLIGLLRDMSHGSRMAIAEEDAETARLEEEKRAAAAQIVADREARKARAAELRALMEEFPED